jgi:hypothetical protein
VLFCNTFFFSCKTHSFCNTFHFLAGMCFFARIRVGYPEGGAEAAFWVFLAEWCKNADLGSASLKCVRSGDRALRSLKRGFRSKCAFLPPFGPIRVVYQNGIFPLLHSP